MSWSQISEVTDAAGFAPDLGRRSLGGWRRGLVKDVGDALLVVRKWKRIWMCRGWSLLLCPCAPLVSACSRLKPIVCVLTTNEVGNEEKQAPAVELLLVEQTVELLG